jgi:hypothetical protein
MELDKKEKSKAVAAAKAGMDEKTARKYRRIGKLPSQVKKQHDWRTRPDPFVTIWDEAKGYLDTNPGLEAKTLFEYFQREHPGEYADGQLRTFQRKVKTWRALEGPSQEVYFPQKHFPAQLCESDFTWMNSLGITINKIPFNHLIYHFVLTYSNWETGSVCFSESFESLSYGFQNALWELGGVPRKHRTDRLSAAVHKDCNPEEFTLRYKTLLNHYSLEGERIRSGEAHENGDIEQRHYRFKKALDQALMLRGSRDFESREAYEDYLHNLFAQLNMGRRERFMEELSLLHRLPERRLDDFRWLQVRVSPFSTVRVAKNTYSLHSRLKGETVRVKLFAEYFDVYYAQRRVDRIPRLRGEHQHYIQYRHIIESLLRKPGAFENYRYKEDLFPTIRFRMAYDHLCKKSSQASKEYLKILHLAAQESEAGVDQALRIVFEKELPVHEDTIKKILESGNKIEAPRDVHIDKVDLGHYDVLLEEEAAYGQQ